MNLQKAKILLEKINSLHKSMSVDADNIANIEKDLMRDYIRQLYDAYISEHTPSASTAPKMEIIKSTPKAKRPVKPKPVVEIVRPAAPPQPVVTSPKPTPPPPKPRVIDIPDSLKEISHEASTPVPAPTPIPSPTPTEQPKPVAPKATAPVSEAVEALFEYNQGKELSEKLSNLPIKDLRKSMGLNEKIFTINELFGGDQNAFDTAILMLNSFDNFDQAKAYLMENIANKYDWPDKRKIKKAKNLIKLIRRRYL